MAGEDNKALKIYRKLRDEQKLETISEGYYYACPRRYNKDPDNTKLYDSTAIDAVEERVNELHGQIYPPFRQWINILPETIIPDNFEKKWQEHKDLAEKKMSLALEISNFHIEIQDTLTDTLFCRGALLLHTGSPENPFIFENVDWDSFVTKYSFDKRPLNNFLERSLTLDEIKYRWPDAKNLEQLSNNNEDSKYTVIDCYLYDDEKDLFDYEVWLTQSELLLYSEKGRKQSPWIVYNFSKRMQNNQGYGPVLDVLPDVKTANKVEELILKNASITVVGIWQADDDGVINPATVKLVPGAIIPKAVGSKGLTPLESGRNFDVSQFILNDMREKIRKQIHGLDLPDASSGIRTAYEFSVRKEAAARSEVPQTLRLTQSNDQLVKLMYGILSSPEMASSPFYIEPFAYTEDGENLETIVKIKAANPLIDLQLEVDAQKQLQALSNAASFFGEAAFSPLKIPDFIVDFLKDNGVKQKYFKSDEEIKQAEQAKIEQAMLQAQLGQMQEGEKDSGSRG